MEQQQDAARGANGWVWINGEVVEYADARVSVEDRGFQFADGVYEVVRAYHGRAFELDAHMARLQRSAEAIEIVPPLSCERLGEVALELLARIEQPDAELYFQLTRGATRRQHLFPQGIEGTAIVGVRGITPPPATLKTEGCRIATAPDQRWARCDLKVIGLLPNVLAKQRAHRAGAFEAVFVRDGFVTEGSSTNVFIVAGETLITPKADQRILHGITRAVALRLARELGLAVEERDVTLDELLAADEVMLASTMLELTPVVGVDDRPVGNGRPGPVWSKLYGAFQAALPAPRRPLGHR